MKQTNQQLFLFICWIVCVFSSGPCEVYDVAPWTNAHLQMRKFSDRLKDLEELVYLYPHTDKNEAFSQYYTNDGKNPVYNARNPMSFFPFI